MRRTLFVLLAALLLSAVGCGEQKHEAALLRIEDREYDVEDFKQYLVAFYSGDIEKISRDLLESYLTGYEEWKLLAFAAETEGGLTPDEELSPLKREEMLIGLYILGKAKDRYGEDTGWLDKIEEKLQAGSEKRYTETRYEIRTAYFATEREADQAYRALRSNPAGFDRYLEGNPEEMKPSMGRGTFTIWQIYENAREKVLAVAERVKSQNRPAVTEKIPVEEGGGYLIIQVLQVLPPASIENEDVVSFLEELVYSAEREELRQSLVRELQNKYDIEFNKEIAVRALCGSDSE